MEMFPDDKEIQWWQLKENKERNPRTGSNSMMLDIICYVADGKAVQPWWFWKNNNNPETNGTAKLIMEHSGLPNGRISPGCRGIHTRRNIFPARRSCSIWVATKMHNTTQEKKSDIAKGYMSGKISEARNQKGTNILVTENKSYSDF